MAWRRWVGWVEMLHGGIEGWVDDDDDDNNNI